MSSPASGIFFLRYLDCQALFDAIRAGVALMRALLDCRAAWAYIWLAFVAPVGVKLTSTSAFDSVRVLATLLGFESLTTIFSPAIDTRISRAIDAVSSRTWSNGRKGFGIQSLVACRLAFRVCEFLCQHSQ